jgi:ERF superfamily
VSDEAAPWRLEDPTPRLNAALAHVQAELPKITKSEKADIPGKEGKRGFDYKYAGLDAISEAALPLLGKNGLAFTAWPTLIDGKFVLLYELLHESGEQKGGIFPLAASGKPQELGGLITYYRRYALCAVTGIAPAGEDNDAADANHPQQYDSPRSAAEAFEHAAPAPRRAERQAATAADDPWQSGAPGPDASADTDQEWLGSMLDRAGKFATRDAGIKLWAEAEKKGRAGGCSDEDARKIAEVLKARHAELAVGAARDPDPWDEKVNDCLTTEDCAAALADLEVQDRKGTVDRKRAGEVRRALQARTASLEKEAAA